MNNLTLALTLLMNHTCSAVESNGMMLITGGGYVNVAITIDAYHSLKQSIDSMRKWVYSQERPHGNDQPYDIHLAVDKQLAKKALDISFVEPNAQ